MSNDFLPQAYLATRIFPTQPIVHDNRDSLRIKIAKSKCCSVACCLLALLFSFTAILCGLVLNLNTKVTVADYQQILICPPFAWHTSVFIKPQDLRTQSFLLGEKPQLIPSKFMRTDRRVMTVSHNSYHSESYQLLKGSNISVNYIAKTPTNFYLIEGETRFNNWELSKPVPYLAFGQNTQGFFKYTVKIDQEKLFFIWEARSQTTSTVFANITLNLVIYDDTANQQKNCTGECEFHLEYQGEQCVLIEPYDTLISNHSQTISYTVWLRGSVFLAVAGSISLLPCFCCLVFAALAQYWSKKLRKPSRQTVLQVDNILISPAPQILEKNSIEQLNHNII